MTNHMIEITVVSKPSYVSFDCPHCDEEATIDYDDFLEMMDEDYFEDWTGEKIICPECGKEIMISSIDWD